MPNQHTKKAAAKAQAAKKVKARDGIAEAEQLQAALDRMAKGIDVPVRINMISAPASNACTEKALKLNLPHFTLLPGDNFTTTLIDEWIALAVQHGTSPEKIADARALLKRIQQWRTDHPFACKIPS